MIGHLTIAGLAEFVLTAGVVRALQRSEPRLLAQRSAAGGALELTAVAPPSGAHVLAALRPPLPALRSMWVAVALVMVLTPLGLLTAGSAWGEWRASDFADPAARARIAAASRNAPAPAAAPAGLERLAGVWTAPLRGYAPAFVSSPAAGALLSAMFGTGLIVLALFAVRAVALRPRQR